MGNTSHSSEVRRCTPEHHRHLLAEFAAAGQEQVFRFVPRLTPVEREALFTQAESIDLLSVRGLLDDGSPASAGPPRIAPYPEISLGDSDRLRAKGTGESLLRSGRVAFLTVAGGQATRLGVSVPKGCFPFAPYSRKTLFAWHAEKVHAAERRYGSEVPWIILLSAATETDTLRYFEENNHFGLGGRIRFILQGMNPAVDAEGRILLESPSRIFMAPNGHGGVLSALKESATIEWLHERGIDLISYFQVDNPHLSPADPVYLGCHVERDAEMSAKVIRKLDPHEPVGVLCYLDGRPGILEYSELPDDLAESRDPGGELVYGLVNIAAHIFSVEFIERIANVQFPHHCALKQVACIDDDGLPVRVPGRKFETFVFDAIPLARGFSALETDRLEEFVPLKNAEGDNSPVTVREGLLARSRRWYARTGLPVPSDERALEIGPSLADDFDTFVEWASKRDPGGLC